MLPSCHPTYLTGVPDAGSNSPCQNVLRSAWVTVRDQLSIAAELRGIGCHLYRAAGPESEAGGDLPADRGACAWRYRPLRAMTEKICMTALSQKAHPAHITPVHGGNEPEASPEGAAQGQDQEAHR